jgi:hypothetical protein
MGITFFNYTVGIKTMCKGLVLWEIRYQNRPLKHMYTKAQGSK